MRRSFILLLGSLIMLGTLFAPAAAGAPSPGATVLRGKVFEMSGGPRDIAATKTGTAWAVMLGGKQAAARIKGGVVKEFGGNNSPGASVEVNEITIGRNNTIWFPTDSRTPGAKGYGMARVMPDGRTKRFDPIFPSTVGTGVGGIGFDARRGVVWYGIFFNHAGRINSSGRVLPETTPDHGFPRNTTARGWAADRSGQMWFTFGLGIGRVESPIQITTFTKGFLKNPQIDDIVLGPDGNLWFTDAKHGIGRITPGGSVKTYPVPGHPNSITVGPDNALWFTVADKPTLHRMTLAGKVTEFEGPEATSSGIARGAGRTLWYVTPRHAVVRVTVP